MMNWASILHECKGRKCWELLFAVEILLDAVAIGLGKSERNAGGSRFSWARSSYWTLLLLVHEGVVTHGGTTKFWEEGDVGWWWKKVATMRKEMKVELLFLFHRWRQGCSRRGGIPSQMTFVDTEAFLYCTRELLSRLTTTLSIEGMQLRIQK